MQAPMKPAISPPKWGSLIKRDYARSLASPENATGGIAS
jgi:hypothetical protein